MEIIQEFQAYIASQKAVGTQFILIGIGLLVIAILFHFSGSSQLSSGLKIGAAICGLLIISGGVGYRTTETKLLRSQTALYQKNQSEFKKVETERMQKVVKDYPIYQIIFGSFIILSLLIVWVVKKPFWHGVAFSVMILFIAVIIVEGYSHKSIKSYFEYLTM